MNTIYPRAAGPFFLGDSPPPPGPGPGDALIRVRRVGICGTDIHAFAGDQPYFTYPRILGHELGVEVMAVGEGVSNVRAGDTCAVEPYSLRPMHCLPQREDELLRRAEGARSPHRRRHARANRDTRPQAASFRETHPGSVGAGRDSRHRRARCEPGGSGARRNRARDWRRTIGLSVVQFAIHAGARVLAMDLSGNTARFLQGDVFGRDGPAGQEHPVESVRDMTDGVCRRLCVMQPAARDPWRPHSSMSPPEAD